MHKLLLYDHYRIVMTIFKLGSLSDAAHKDLQGFDNRFGSQNQEP